MTSNIGSHLIQEAFETHAKDIEKAEEVAKNDVMELLKETIRPEFLNRIDEIIMFHPLLKKEIRNIIHIQLKQLKKQIAENGIQIDFSDYVIDYLAENGYDVQFGARPLKRFIQKSIVNTLSKKILAGEINRDHPVLVDVFDGIVVFRNEHPEELEKKNK